ncbi:hypothetical protein KY284_020944 [Solanum tuberosum]|nr:hypothetical protein KY284_020944 [Solanum tuberosum]
MVTPMTQVVSFADLNILPTYYAIKSTSKVGNSNAEQVFDEMPLAEDSPFSSANGVVMSMEGYATTTEAHSSEGHSDLEDEILEEVCNVQAKFEGSVSAVQKTMVANDQEFVLEDFTPILGNIHLNVHVSTDGRLSKYASNSINHCSCLFTNFNSFSLPYVIGQRNKFEPSGQKLPLDQVLHTCCCHKKTCSYLHFELEPLLDILPFGSVVDAWVDTGQLCDSLSYVAETPHKFSTILERYPYVWNRFSQQLFDSMSQTCHYYKVFAENPQGEAIGMHCQFDLMRLTTGNSIIASYFIPSMFKGVTLTLDSSRHSPSLHPGWDWHSKTIAGPKRTLGLAYLTQWKT